MVSIPDWSRLGRLFEPQRRTSTNAHKSYATQQEEVAIKKAEEHGFFLKASRSYLENSFGHDVQLSKQRRKSVLDKFDIVEKDLSRVKMINLGSARLKNVGELGLCNNLTICLLGNNHIKTIDGLISCTQLTRLDLHSNRILMVPGASFWSCLRSLKLLNLHDNPIGRLENLSYLASCPNLIALTLYDTPLSLKKNYRHHVVNSIWTLKALDHYVISDEEIIEDADFGGKFAACNPSFLIDLCPECEQESDYNAQFEKVQRTLATINSIMARCSPVLVIQRYIRGLLIRKIVAFQRQYDTWAAVTIQRQYREYKGLTYKPPPGTPAIAHRATKLPDVSGPSDASRIDYDTYMQNRRPGSRPSSQTSMTSPKDRLPPTPVPSATPFTEAKRRIFINLAKLQTATMSSLQDDAVVMETLLPTDRPYVTLTKSGKQEIEPKHLKRFAKVEPKKKQVKIKSVKQFFGPVVTTAEEEDESRAMSTDGAAMTSARGDTRAADRLPTIAGAGDSEDIPLISFRLIGLKRKVVLYDPLPDMLIAKRNDVIMIQKADEEHHMEVANKPKPIAKKHRHVTKDEFTRNRNHKTMGFSCLWAVNQAYQDRTKAEKVAAKMETVLSTKEDREAAKERIKLYHDEKRQRAIKDRDADRKRTTEVMERRELERLSTVDVVQQTRQQSRKVTQQRRDERDFTTDFQVQNNSVANALLRHDRQARFEDILQTRNEAYKLAKGSENDQQDVVRKYLEHRQLMRQTETAMQRAALDTKMLQEANDRLMEAKSRVAQQKARSATVEAFYPLPSSGKQSLPPVSATKQRTRVNTMEGLDRYETGVVMQQGRVGRHHTQVTY